MHSPITQSRVCGEIPLSHKDAKEYKGRPIGRVRELR